VFDDNDDGNDCLSIGAYLLLLHNLYLLSSSTFNPLIPFGMFTTLVIIDCHGMLRSCISVGLCTSTFIFFHLFVYCVEGRGRLFLRLLIFRSLFFSLFLFFVFILFICFCHGSCSSGPLLRRYLLYFHCSSPLFFPSFFPFSVAVCLVSCDFALWIVT